MKALANRAAIIVSWAGALFVLGGCGGSNAAAGRGGELRGARGSDVARPVCDPSSGQVRAVDANADGTPDIRHVMAGSTMRCSLYDMNFDGRVDVTRFYQANGTTVSLEEHDFDFDGRVDQLAYFNAEGVVERKELDTNFDNAIDTWVWCEGALMSRVERDRRHRGNVDSWETYDRGHLAEIRYDDNNDGRPEKWEIFAVGRLREVRMDTNEDGEADRVETIPDEAAGPNDEGVSCDGSPLPHIEPPPAPPAPAAAPPAATEDAAGDESADGADDEEMTE